MVCAAEVESLGCGPKFKPAGLTPIPRPGATPVPLSVPTKVVPAESFNVMVELTEPVTVGENTITTEQEPAGCTVLPVQ